MSIELVTITAEFKTAGGAVLMNTPISFILREDIASEDDVYHAQVFRGWINASGLLKAADGSSAFQLPTYSNGTSAARFSVVMPRGVNLKDYMTVPTGKLNFNVTYSASPLQLSGLLNTGAGAATDTVLVAIDDAINSAISGTTNYIPKFTGANAIGNSSISDTGAITTFGATSHSVFTNSVIVGTGSSDARRVMQIVKTEWAGSNPRLNLLYLEGEITNNKGAALEIYFTKAASNTHDDGHYGIYADVYNLATTATSANNVFGILAMAKHAGGTGRAFGGDFRAMVQGGGSITEAVACNAVGLVFQNSTVETYALYKSNIIVDGAATVITDLHGLHIQNWQVTNGAAVTNSYGIRIDNSIDVGGDTSYAIFCESVSQSVFSGSITAASFSTTGTIGATGTINGGGFDVTKTNFAPASTTNLINLSSTVDNNQQVRAINIALTRNNAGSAGVGTVALNSTVTNNFAGTSTNFNPHSFNLLNSGSGVIATTSRGLYVSQTNLGSATITTNHVIYAEMLNTGSGSTITNAAVYKVRVRNLTSATITTLKGLDFSEWSNTATVTTSYVIYIAADTSVGSTPFCIYSLSTSPSEFSGTIQATAFKVGGNQVVGARGAAIADADGSLADLTTKFNTWLASARTHGLIAT